MIAPEHRPRRPVRPLPRAALTAAVLVLTACAGGTGTEVASSASAGSTGMRTPAPTAQGSPSATAEPGSTGPAENTEGEGAAPDFGTASDPVDPSADARLTVTGLRIGAHEGYDRVVVDLAGTGTPGWSVTEDTEAITDPEGRSIDLGGAGVLTVRLTGIGYPFETGATELAPDTVDSAAGTTAVTQVAFTGTFEGQAEVFVGTTAAASAYRVFLLADPVRVVVDVQR